MVTKSFPVGGEPVCSPRLDYFYILEISKLKLFKNRTLYYKIMHIITRARLIEFAEKYPNTKTALETWYRKVKQTDYDNFNELRLMFPSADQVGKCTIFNIGGHKVRLIAIIHYNRHKIYIRHVLTHTEYDLNKWKIGC